MSSFLRDGLLVSCQYNNPVLIPSTSEKNVVPRPNMLIKVSLIQWYIERMTHKAAIQCVDLLAGGSRSLLMCKIVLGFFGMTTF